MCISSLFIRIPEFLLRLTKQAERRKTDGKSLESVREDHIKRRVTLEYVETAGDSITLQEQ